MKEQRADNGTDAETGRFRQRARTRQFLLEAARAMLTDGEVLTIQALAERTGVSRATIYRYFSSNDELVVHAASPVTDDPLADPDWPYFPKEIPADLPKRAAALVRATGAYAFDHEAEIRALLRVSLEPDSAERGLVRRTFRQRWIANLLADLPSTVPDSDRRRLAAALTSLFGSDAVVWTTDMAKIDREQALDLLAWMAETLVRATIDGAVAKPPAD